MVQTSVQLSNCLNFTNTVDRILPFSREKGDPGFKSLSELRLLLFHPTSFCVLSSSKKHIRFTLEMCKSHYLYLET